MVYVKTLTCLFTVHNIKNLSLHEQENMFNQATLSGLRGYNFVGD